MERLIFGILRYSLLKFVYVIDQSCHPLVVHPFLRKILDPPLDLQQGTATFRRLRKSCKTHTCRHVLVTSSSVTVLDSAGPRITSSCSAGGFVSIWGS